MAWMAIAHWTHVASGLVWGGGYVFMAVAVWPMLLKLPSKEAKTHFEAISRGAGPMMAISGNLVFILGILRGTLWGPLKSWNSIVTTPYGHTWLLALALTFALMVHGAVHMGKVADKLWSNGPAPSAAMIQNVRRHNYFALCLFAAILACMVLMKFGL